MADYQVTCVTHTGTHEGISFLGGPSWNGTRQQVITWIEAGHTFYTYASGKRANVGVVDGAHGKYLRTYADGVWTDNLLALGACSIA